MGFVSSATGLVSFLTLCRIFQQSAKRSSVDQRVFSHAVASNPSTTSLDIGLHIFLLLLLRRKIRLHVFFHRSSNVGLDVFFLGRLSFFVLDLAAQIQLRLPYDHRLAHLLFPALSLRLFRSRLRLLVHRSFLFFRLDFLASTSFAFLRGGLLGRLI